MDKRLSVWKDRWNTPFFSEFDKFFKDWQYPVTRGDDNFNFTPSCEVNEDKESYSFKFDLPGVKKEHIKVEMHDNVLTVSAERKEEAKTEDEKNHLSEVFYGSYTRSFTLPSTVEEADVAAKYEDGVLNIRVPKTEKNTRKQISVQ